MRWLIGALVAANFIVATLVYRAPSAPQPGAADHARSAVAPVLARLHLAQGPAGRRLSVGDCDHYGPFESVSAAERAAIAAAAVGLATRLIDESEDPVAGTLAGRQFLVLSSARRGVIARLRLGVEVRSVQCEQFAGRGRVY